MNTPATSGDARILAGLDGQIRPVALSFGYRLSLMVASVLLLLLPLLYLALIGVVIYGMWAYLTYLPFDPSMIEGHGRNKVGAFLYWLIPLFIGAMLVLILVKPIFARSPRAVQPLKLDRRREPLLFNFIEKLCRVVGAPAPAAIHLDNEVNASVRLRSGRRKGLILTLGAPLVAGLSLAQLAGVLAHEFGHFKQGAGLRLSFFVRRMNAWLSRVAYERDSIDAWLVRESKDSDNGMIAMIALNLCRGAVWSTRKILAGLVWLAHAISSYQMRQMEFDADRYEARLVGFPVFATTTDEMHLLGVAHQRTMASLEECWNDGRLPDSLAQLTRVHRQSMDDEVIENISKATLDQRTGLFDTHPAPADRLASAQQEPGPPVFASDQAAEALFDDFPALAQLVTRAHYCSVLGEAVRPEQLMTVERTVAQLEQSSHEREALGAYFKGGLSSLRPLAVGAITAGSPVTEVDVARRLAKASVAELESGLEAYSEAYKDWISTLQAEALLEIKISFSAKKLGLPMGDLPTILHLQEQALKRLEHLDDTLRPHELRQGQRLGAALGLLAIPEISKTVDADGHLQTEVPTLVELTVLMGSLFKLARELNADRAVFALLASQLEDHQDDKDLGKSLGNVMVRIIQKLEHLHGMLEGIAYPFEHNVEAMTLAYYVVMMPKEASDIDQLFAASGNTLEQFYDVYFRAAGRLAAIAGKLEEATGLGSEKG